MKRNISVFIASPGDLSNERSLFRDAINQLNVGFGDGANVEFEALGWEDTCASTGRRSQGVINEEINKCDVFILAMHRRWGQKAPDAEPYSSYTEEEFHRALSRLEKEPKPEIFVFFKKVDPASEADPGPQLKKVMEFRKKLEDSRQVLYHYFNDDQSFIKEVSLHLRAYAKGELPKTDSRQDSVILPASVVEEVERAKSIAIKKSEEAEKAHDAQRASLLKIEKMQLQEAEDAASLSKEGKIEFARQKFLVLGTESTNLRILSLAYEFYYRTGDWDSAIFIAEKCLDLSGKHEISKDTAMALSNLGNVYASRGELDRANEVYLKSLAISEALSHEEYMADNYINLGILYGSQGKLDHAEEVYRKALAINEALDRKEGLESVYSNLGILYSSRGELDRAEEMHLKSLTINEALDHKEGMARNYGNLGNQYSFQDKLDLAEEMLLKSLAINEALDRKEDMASVYGNLGILYSIRGELEHAEELYQKSLVIEEYLDRKEGMANGYGNLGKLYHTRGELKHAKEMYQKSLALYREINSPQTKTIEKWLHNLHKI